MAYYGLALGSAGQSSAATSLTYGDICIGQLLAAVVEVPVLLLLTPAAKRFGVRETMSGLAFIFAAALSALPLVERPQIHLLLTLIARASGMGASTLKWLVNAETYPEKCRVTGVAFASLAGYLGGALGPIALPYFALHLSPLSAALTAPILLLLSVLVSVLLFGYASWLCTD